MILIYQKNLLYQLCSVPAGVPNVKCTKVHQMYQNSQGMMPSVQINTDPIPSVPNATGVPNVTTVPIVPKMTKNDPSVPKSCLAHFSLDGCQDNSTMRTVKSIRGRSRAGLDGLLVGPPRRYTEVWL